MQNISDEIDINDVFDSLVNAEEAVVERGYLEGEEKGKAEGELEGYHLGYHRGAEIGSEIGYYLGFSCFYLNLEQNKLNPKSSAALTKLKNLAESVPAGNVPDLDILAALEECRASFKKACVHLRISPRLPNPSID